MFLWVFVYWYWKLLHTVDLEGMELDVLMGSRFGAGNC